MLVAQANHISEPIMRILLAPQEVNLLAFGQFFHYYSYFLTQDSQITKHVRVN